jgi:hypothetical protein
MAAMVRMFGAAFTVLIAMRAAAAVAALMGHRFAVRAGLRRRLHGGLGSRERDRIQQHDHI